MEKITVEFVKEAIRYVLDNFGQIPSLPQKPVEQVEEYWELEDVSKDIFRTSEFWKEAVAKGRAEVVGETYIVSVEDADDQLFPTLSGSRQIVTRTPAYVVRVKKVRRVNEDEFDAWEKAVEQWFANLPTKVKIGLAAVYYEYEGSGYSAIDEEWLNDFLFSIHYKFSPRTYAFTVELLSNPTEFSKISQAITEKLKYNVVYLPPQIEPPFVYSVEENGVLYYPITGKVIYDATIVDRDEAIRRAQSALQKKLKEKQK